MFRPLGSCISRKLINSVGVRTYHKEISVGVSKHNNSSFADENVAVNVSKDINNINTRLGNLSLTAQYLTGSSLLSTSAQGSSLQSLTQIKQIHLPTASQRKVEAPSSEAVKYKTFITDSKTEIKEPEKKTRISEPVTTRIKKHAARMVILRRRKMKKHKRKRLWARMYLKFLANKNQTKKRSEIQFRSRLAAKVTEARKFNAEEYVKQYLIDFHTPLIPGTYKGKRLPQWLILELMEQDKQKEKEELLYGKTYTTKEDIVKQGETVNSFIERTWK